jgi:hypothetical protein
LPAFKPIAAALRVAAVQKAPVNVTFRHHTFLKTFGSKPPPVVKFDRFRRGASSACRLNRYHPVGRNVSTALRRTAKSAAMQ